MPHISVCNTNLPQGLSGKKTEEMKHASDISDTYMYLIVVPSYISEMFTRKGTCYNLGNSDFEIPWFNTIRYGKHTLRFQGPYMWSKLENSMRELPSLSIFKTNIRRVDLASLVELSGNCCNLCSKYHLQLSALY